MTKEAAQQRRDAAVQAVKDAQAACKKAIGQDRDRAKVALAVRLEELAEAKAELRRANLATSGAKPIETPPPQARRELTVSEIATVLLESFQRLLIINPSHVAIRTLRQHFDAERLKEVPPAALRPSEPLPLRSAGRNFLDASRRQASGPGALLYPKQLERTSSK